MAQLTESQNIEIVKKILINISDKPITFDNDNIYTNFIKICQELLITSSLTEEERINMNILKKQTNEEDIRIQEITEYVPKELHKYAKKLIKLYPGITSNPYNLPRNILTDYNKTKATNESYNRYLDQEYIGMSKADYNLLENSKFYISELLKNINPSFVKYVDAFFNNNLHKRSLFSLFDDTLSSVIHMTDEDIVIFNNYLTNELLKKIDPIFKKYSININKTGIPFSSLFNNSGTNNITFLTSKEIGIPKEYITKYKFIKMNFNNIKVKLPENLKKYTLAFIMDNQFNNTIFKITHARLKEFYGMTDIEIKQMSDLSKSNSTPSDNNSISFI
jgi:hypothetical protein